MAMDYDDLTVQYEEDGQVLVEELEKVFLHKGTWTTVLFLYRQWDPKSGDFGPKKATIRRFQKRGGAFRKTDSVNLSEKSAPVLVERLRQWFGI